VLLKHNCKIVLGTDSYSSNWQLNIASEIKTLRDHFPLLPIATILKWATANGAEVLNQNVMLGSLQAGKKPGIVLLETDPLNKEFITGKCNRIA
jgi:imidazolonepropionase-like amidohydrolase